VCLEDAAAALGELDGRGDTVRTDLIDGIFSKFCVGK
jgi:tRNA U34 5-carboxymethylaminomethyl modifying GTPase MnmE/TrmE